MPVPSNKCGLIIGKGGETIKNINSSCGVHCEVDKNAPPDARDKNFVIKGPAEGVARAKDMILEKLGQQSGYGGKAVFHVFHMSSTNGTNGDNVVLISYRFHNSEFIPFALGILP